MIQKTIFIFAYYSLKDPIFQSAVLPYFEDFPEKDRFRFVVLTWEQEKYKLTREQESKERQILKGHNIVWHRTTWHSGKFKLIKKGFDFLYGLLLSLFLILRYKASAIYSEGFPGAVMGHYLSKLTNKPHHIHTFEPHSQYMVEAKVWSEESWEAKLLNSLEHKIAFHATSIMTATNAMIDRLKPMISKYTHTLRVPSCVDTDLFKYDENDREKLRAHFNISESDILLVYIGKFGGMYMDEELFDFFSICQTSKNLTFKYHIYSPDNLNEIHNHFEDVGIPSSNYHVGVLTKNQVPSYLSMADFGLVPVRQYPGKRFCSPIKNGEYWACGLPIIIPKGISDDYLFAEDNKIGILLNDTSERSMKKTLLSLEKWFIQENIIAVRQRCREFVEKDRSVEKYKKLYKDIFLQKTSKT